MKATPAAKLELLLGSPKYSGGGMMGDDYPDKADTKQESAREVMKALKSGNEEAFAAALEAFVYACQDNDDMGEEY